ncbi:MAG: hypothetical protein AAFN16_23625, partial [Pseudomonadota bacterium]
MDLFIASGGIAFVVRRHASQTRHRNWSMRRQNRRPILPTSWSDEFEVIDLQGDQERVLERQAVIVADGE